MKMESYPAGGNPEITVFAVDGVVDSVNVTSFFQAITKLFNEGSTKVVLDLSQVNYLSSGALSVIADAFRKADSLGGRMVICAVKESVHDLFLVVQFDRIIDFYRSIDTAVSSFEAVP